MAILRLIVTVLLPPLGVWNRGCITVMLVGAITGIIWFFAYLNHVLAVAYWLPGLAVALFIVLPEIMRTPGATEDRSRDILGTGQAFKNQALPGEAPTASASRSGRQTPPTAQSTKPPSGPPKPPWED
jgi:hypothetical protein